MKTFKPGIIITCIACSMLSTAIASNAREDDPPAGVIGARKINPTTVELLLAGNKTRTIDFHGENIFRLFQDNDGGIIREPEARPPARMLVDNPRRPVARVEVDDDDERVSIATTSTRVTIDKATGLMTVTSLMTGVAVIEEARPMLFEEGKVTVTLRERPGEFFYGGGVQNGRFSHKGKVIAIENQNSWTDGGVASPTPFYWSTSGYGVMWHTFRKGKYDFGAREPGVVKMYHETGHADLFYMVSDGAAALLGDFYQLTGNPALLPKFAFYQGHLNAYNRDYWTGNPAGILFEDGKRYKESQKDDGGIKESLNGEKGNYQFSARAVIDRYQAHDMPLGWLLPNDGYGAGYGQEETLDGNVQNLKQLGEYARERGVEIGLWTQSNLHPRPDASALLQRDIVKEVRDAGVRVLKTDVAWVGAGYSFGLNGIADAARVMNYYGNDCRPFIISLDGWAGTQRYAAVWTGDQTGGQWEYIRFHIPTYTGAGLSGQPNITSDMDGIFGGKNPVVNTRDFQWKAFTPMQLNMDGWGSNEKYPHALGEPATSINRWYLKLKSGIMPYAYSIAREAVDGLPMIRAMFLDDANDYTMGVATRYQFLYGPNLLVAPVYRATRPDEEGNDERDGIYLPRGSWIDYFTGERYEGNRVIHGFDAPLWKLPVFAREGAIIPVTAPHNNPAAVDKSTRAYEIFPGGSSAFTEYDDDGSTMEYTRGQGVSTRVESVVDARGRVTITVHPASGNFREFVKMKSTGFRVHSARKPSRVTARVGTSRVKLREVASLDEFLAGENVYLYHAPDLNRYATPGSPFEEKVITGDPRLLVKIEPVDVTARPVTLALEGFARAPGVSLERTAGTLEAPANARVLDENREPYSLKVTWSNTVNADYHEIEFNNMLYSTIRDTALQFDDLKPGTPYSFKLRAVNRDGQSPWTTIEATTRVDPVEFAIRGITARSTAADQRGSGIEKFVDLDEESTWHTDWNATAVPFEITLDLHAIYQLDRLRYLPRAGNGNGTLTRGSVQYSRDGVEWINAGDFAWAGREVYRDFPLAGHPEARLVKILVTEGRRGFGSGRELYVFKVPGSRSYLPGDINDDGRIDENDLTSYRNYTGSRRGDADFEGYVSNGDMNRDDVIDVFDISHVATRLEGGVNDREVPPVEGKIELITPARQHAYRAGEIIEIRARGTGLRSVNAFGFALPYDTREVEFLGIQARGTREMEDFTNDRLHVDGKKVLYPTFVNVGEKEPVEGTLDLFVARFKALRDVSFRPVAIDGLLVDKQLRARAFGTTSENAK